jgi:hypothetical protein
VDGPVLDRQKGYQALGGEGESDRAPSVQELEATEQ